jgi:sugar/nucleoside kinase (ribokinase family)
VKISAAGCCLIDYVYAKVSYDRPGFQRFLSKRPGDGGIIQGGLVFTEALSACFGMELGDILKEILGPAEADAVNLGGPAVISLVNAAQLLHGRDVTCRFHACVGNDTAGQLIRGFLQSSPVESVVLTDPGAPSPTTIVLADPSCHGGNGERSFLNTIGAAGRILPGDLPADFFQSDIVLFGGTALTPALHDGLHSMLDRAKSAGAITVVGTVYDFRNEKLDPEAPWPLGVPDACGSIDLLVTDAVEALRLSGAANLASAAENLMNRGVGALVITNGERDMLAWSSGRIFSPLELCSYPVSTEVRSILKKDPSRLADTTGCGDNFLGGLIASLAMQLEGGSSSLGRGSSSLEGGSPSLEEALSWGAASGGFSCFYAGGLYSEASAGEKLQKIQPLAEAYRAGLDEVKGGE